MKLTRHHVAPLIVAACLVVAVPIGAWAAGLDDDAPDDIPGIEVPASPIKGAADSTTDADDVYSVHLEAGQWIYASMSGASGTDLDLFLFGPGSTSVSGSGPAAAFSEKEKSSAEKIIFQARETGTHYLDVYAFSGTGSYSVTYGFPTGRASVTATAPATCAWQASTAITGTVKNAEGAPAVGEKVHLYSKPYGATDYKKIASATTSSGGAYSFTITPKRQTRYQVRHVGSPKLLPHTSPTRVVTPKAYLNTPYLPSTIRKGVSVAGFGYLKPKHPAGGHDVKIRCYRMESGVWRLRKTVAATNYDYNSYTKYRARFSLPYSGKWKIVARISGDGLHADTVSGARYRTVN